MREKNIDKFSSDAAANKGYLYSATDKLSCRLSNSRMTKAVGQMIDLRGKSVIDIGCGDGTYTMDLLAMGAASVLGVDAAEGAITRAREKSRGSAAVRFEVQDIYQLGPFNARFHVAVVRGILHHLYDVEAAIRRICAIAGDIIVIEPNGYNPVLKLIEKTSRYHIEHEEKSYRPGMLDKWFIQNGGEIVQSMYVGLVPMFCPDAVAKGLKFIEPLVERTPLLRSLCCGQYVQKVRIR
jgi:ubiquinone/menaquinone biosynthesis C-methylase UbiE